MPCYLATTKNITVHSFFLIAEYYFVVWIPLLLVDIWVILVANGNKAYTNVLAEVFL